MRKSLNAVQVAAKAKEQGTAAEPKRKTITTAVSLSEETLAKLRKAALARAGNGQRMSVSAVIADLVAEHLP